MIHATSGRATKAVEDHDPRSVPEQAALFTKESIKSITLLVDNNSDIVHFGPVRRLLLGKAALESVVASF